MDALGYFLIPDADDLNADLDSLIGEELMVMDTAAGHVVANDGTPLLGARAPAFFSDEAFNPGGFDHFIREGQPSKYDLLVEDLVGGGDRDFNDAIFSVEITPEEVLL